jgi:hypothetical protein
MACLCCNRSLKNPKPVHGIVLAVSGSSTGIVATLTFDHTEQKTHFLNALGNLDDSSSSDEGTPPQQSPSRED